MSENNNNDLNEVFEEEMDDADVITVPIDETLSNSGEAADAAAVGAALALKADKDELPATIKVNGQQADNQGLILINGTHIPVNGSTQKTLAEAVSEVSGMTAETIPMSEETGAATIAAEIEDIKEDVSDLQEAIDGMEEKTADNIPMETGSTTTVKNAIETLDRKAVKSVNRKLPDAAGDVDLSVVPLAENLQSDKLQSIEGEFIIRTTGGNGAVADGKAYPQHIYGNCQHNGYVAEVLNLTVIPITRTEPDEPITATIDRDTFVAAVDESSTINLYYTTEWSEDPEDYGVTVTGDPVAGDQITIVYVKEQRGTILVADPDRLVGTGWNLFNANDGYARVVKYSDVYGYKIGGTYTSIAFSATLTGDRTSLLPNANGLFNVPSDGYVFVTGGNATDTYVLATWSDWTNGPSTGYWEAYRESGIDLSAVVETYFPYGMLKIGTVRDEIDLVAKRSISRIERMVYSEENRAAAAATGRAYDFDESNIYIVRSEYVQNAITISTEYSVSEHGLEWFTETALPIDTEILYGKNLRDKLERDVLTISAQTLTEEEKAQARTNIGAMSQAEGDTKLVAPTAAGTAGQLLHLKADGGTEWTTQGTPTDAQVGTAVSAWLTAHPEATTTVEDGAISRAKLDADLKEKTDAVPDLKSAISEETYNLFPAYNFTNKTVGTMELTVDYPEIILNGSTTDEIAPDITESVILPAGTYHIGNFLGNQGFQIRVVNASDNSSIVQTAGNTSFTLNSETTVFCRVIISANKTLSNAKLKPMLSKNSWPSVYIPNITAIDSVARNSSENNHTNVKSIKDYIAKGKFEPNMLFTFEYGSLSAGNVNSSDRRICTHNPVIVPYNLNIYIKDGFRVYIQYYTGGTYQSNSGWVTGACSILKNTECKIMIGKVTETNAVEVYDLLSAVTFENASDTLLKESEELKAVKGQYNVLSELSDFIIGDEGGGTSHSECVVSTEILYTDTIITLLIAEGYQISTIYYDSEGQIETITTWWTGRYTISRRKYFKIKIKASNGSVVTNVYNLVGKVKFNNNFSRYGTDKGSFYKNIYFRPDEDFDSDSFRIPFVEITNDGILICGGDIRYNGTSDVGVIDIGITKSYDFGTTFSNKQKVLENTGVKADSRVMDACILCNRTTNRVFIFGHQVDSEGGVRWEDQSAISQDIVHDMVYKYSDDNGQTWSEKISFATNFPSFGIGTHFVCIFESPGKGITLDNGTLVVPVQVKLAQSGGSAYSMYSSVMFSTDNGSTWNMIKYVPRPCSECQVVQFENKILLNCRHDDRTQSVNRYVFSMNISDLVTGYDYTEDNAINNPWTEETSMEVLVEPGCTAGFSRVNMFDDVRYIFSNPNMSTERSNITLKTSKNLVDWETKILLRKVSWLGYSCLTAMWDYVFCALEYAENHKGYLALYRIPVDILY